MAQIPAAAVLYTCSPEETDFSQQDCDISHQGAAAQQDKRGRCQDTVLRVLKRLPLVRSSRRRA